MTELKPCPFAEGGETRVVVCDDEGNIHGDLGCEYEQDPWSGLSYGLVHIHEDDNCLIQQEYELLGGFTFDTAEEAIEAWNTRTENTCHVRPTTKDDDPYADGSTLTCLECGFPWLDEFSIYCPHCGRKVIKNER